jgi:hypothetical protein
MTAERKDAFLALSAELTAFGVVDLVGTGLSERYLDTIDGIVGSHTVDALLAAHAALDGADLSDGGGRSIADDQRDEPGGDGDRRRRLRRTMLGDPYLGPVARNLIKLWYSGTWYQLPRSWREVHGARDGDITCTVSAEAYVQGLLWPAIGAHPPGARAPGWASWTSPPRVTVP